MTPNIHTTSATLGDSSYTPDDAVEHKEKLRRQKLKRLRLYAVTIINGETVSRTASVSLEWPSMVAIGTIKRKFGG